MMIRYGYGGWNSARYRATNTVAYSACVLNEMPVSAQIHTSA